MYSKKKSEFYEWKGNAKCKKILTSLNRIYFSTIRFLRVNISQKNQACDSPLLKSGLHVYWEPLFL